MLADGNLVINGRSTDSLDRIDLAKPDKMATGFANDKSVFFGIAMQRSKRPDVACIQVRDGAFASAAGGPSYGSSRGNIWSQLGTGQGWMATMQTSMLNMAPSDQETEVVPPAEEPEESPALRSATISLVVYSSLRRWRSRCRELDRAAMASRPLLKPLRQPAMRMLERLHGARILAGLLLIIVLLERSSAWARPFRPRRHLGGEASRGHPRLQERLSFMREPIKTLQRLFGRWKNVGGQDDPQMLPPWHAAQLF